MAATLAVQPGFPPEYEIWGSVKVTHVTVTLATNDYVTNGIDFSSYVPGTIVGAIVIGNTGAGAVTQIPSVDNVNKKLQLVKGTAGANAEVSNGTSDAQVVVLAILSLD